jgi:hypothetical protein
MANSTDTPSVLQQAIAAIQVGDRLAGQSLLVQLIETEPRNETAWLWLAAVIDSADRKRQCYQRVLAINPHNEVAMKGLSHLEALQSPASPTSRVSDHATAETGKSPTKMWLPLIGCLGLLVVGMFAVIVILAASPNLIAEYVHWVPSSSVTAPSPEILTPSPQLAPTPLPTLPPTHTPPPSVGKWETSFDTSALDDTRTVILRLIAEKEIKGWLTTYQPALILRCKERETNAYVVVGMQVDNDYGEIDVSTARIRFDSDPAQTIKMGESTDGEALFFRDPIPIIRTMVTHNQMVFEFSPFHAAPAETVFDLRGLSAAVTPLQNACGWR